MALEDQNDFQDKQDIPHEKWFFFAHGRKAKNIEGLKEVMEKIDDIEFNHHVNDQRNDFANWVEHVFGEQELAARLRKTYNKEDMHDAIDEFLKAKQPEPVPMAEHQPSRAPRRHRQKAKPDASPAQENPEQEKILPVFEEHDYLTFDDHIAPKIEEINRKQEKLKLEMEQDAEQDAKAMPGQHEEQPEDKHEEYPELPVIKPIDDLDEGLPGEKDELVKYDEPEQGADEKGLSEKELKKIVLGAKQALAEEESKKILWKRHEAELHHKFVIKEFIYGFVLGLIFGMMMLGVIVNLRA
ncbi:hypothetical protein JXB28_02125 [Candidatus Woesearchaeota archaeon]|nr:hypothetical protein [Candidatus Woesearchaeota archaeon]